MLKLTVGFSRNPRVEPLVDGTVKPQNIDLQFVLHPIAELFYRNLKFDEFDVSEMSLSAYLNVIERRDGSKWQWSGLPVFLLQASIWLNLMVNEQANIHDLGDLKGKRFGVTDYLMKAAILRSIFIGDLYGLEPS